MQPHDARDEETIGQPVGSESQEKKARVTPRQVWERTERRPVGDAPQKPLAQKRQRPKLEQVSDEEHFEVKLPSKLQTAQQEAPEEPAVEDPTAELAETVQVPRDAEVAEPAKAAAAEPAEQAPETPQDALEEKGDKKPAMMVEPTMQPGNMRYPFATHGPAPQREGALEESGERQISTGLVVGALIILFAVIFGFIIASQQRKIGGLQDRLDRLEQAVSALSKHSLSIQANSTGALTATPQPSQPARTAKRSKGT
jgi:uncharacterized membrane protein